MFQELLEASIKQIRNTKWVQERFAITNIDTRGFDSPYGTLTLTQAEDHSEENNDSLLAGMTLLVQVAKATNYPEEVMHGGVLAGNMNSIQASDDRIAGDSNLKDTYLVLGGTEGDSKEYTWGYQRTCDKHEIFRPERLDKVLYRGGLVARALTRINVGVVVEGDEIGSSIRARGMELWTTDHYGLMADLEVAEVVEAEEEKKD
ncbi:endonuclease/exonuclease/phosphatase family protein [Trichophyton verrucosum HKI 0517]|uniref:Endonuclease/exonuclease/phosphatase family protein n=1 Tax=Trichophyton verrucosum (strain HKI 0517) TaxID=663202 RepID=D4D8T1_TRIVH|nr:endonuclease/exonuclease/phosphatase family protein [Trichophyton verrucosum HKI 0517]EFE41690.1 endonuclease/exonuclease/phosphatase family protein [Trichophyton verrucosum HKI 0517]